MRPGPVLVELSVVEHPPFADLATAQAAIDAWRIDYNTVRPHQSLDMATPDSRFRPAPVDGLPLRLPAGLVPVTEPVTEPAAQLAAKAPAVPAAAKPPGVVVGAEELVGPPDAVELDRVVPPSGNLAVGRQQFWFGPRLAGQTVSLWMDSATVHISLDAVRVETVPSRLNTADLTRLRTQPGTRPAGPPPAPRAAGPLAARLPIQVDRTANAVGVISLAGTAGSDRVPARRPPGHPPPRRPLLHLIVDGVLTRTMPPRSPSSATGSATPASPARSRPRLSGRHGCSGKCRAAAASRSATNASRSA